MDSKERTELINKISRGIDLAYCRLVEQKKREDGELIFSEDGSIIRIKARDIQIESLPEGENSQIHAH